MGQNCFTRACAATLASCVIACFATASADGPVVMWDGASPNYNFNTLTRTVGDNTYTLNLNAQNTVGGNGTYVQIGPNNAQKGVVLTVQNLNPTVTNGFGTAGAVTVLMKCSDIQSSNANRLLIGILDSGRYENDNSVKIGLGTRSDWGGAIFEWQGVYHSQINQAITSDEQTIALTYSSNAGTAFFVNGERKGLNSGLKSMYFTTPCGISLGGSDSDSGSKLYAMSSMKISAIAVFTSTLTAEQVAAFSFPSSRASTCASEVNAGFGDQEDITLELDDGAVVDGDTTFYAANINFVCNGSITVTPHLNDTTAFDFSRVTGNVTIEYKNESVPSSIPSGNKFTATSVPTWVTDSSKWTGTVAFSGLSITGPNFNNFGNEASAIRLSGVSGWVNTGTEYTVPIILENGDYGFALKLTNGNSPRTIPSTDVDRCSVFHKISGSGSIVDATAKGVWPVIKVYDASGFTGDVSLDEAILLVCDSTTPYSPHLYGMFNTNANKYNTNGVVRIESSNPMTLPVGTTWKANAVIFNGSVDFTTSDPLAEGLTVFTCDGSAIKVDRNADFSINGTPRDQSIYKVKAVGTELQLQKMVGKRVILR